MPLELNYIEEKRIKIEIYNIYKIHYKFILLSIMGDQLAQIRKRRHEEYTLKISLEKKSQDKKEKRERDISFLTNFFIKYYHIFIPTIRSRYKAAISIQRFVRKNYFGPKCLNHVEEYSIPPIYKFRMQFTTTNYIEYSEVLNSDLTLEEHRQIHNMEYLDAIVSSEFLFSYLFDIRKLYPKRNQPIIINEIPYYLQPIDHIRIIQLYDRLCGEDNATINREIDMKYEESLSKDKFKGDIPQRMEIEKMVRQVWME